MYKYYQRVRPQVNTAFNCKIGEISSPDHQYALHDSGCEDDNAALLFRLLGVDEFSADTLDEFIAGIYERLQTKRQRALDRVTKYNSQFIGHDCPMCDLRSIDYALLDGLAWVVVLL